MKLRRVQVDRYMRESIPYKDTSFPVEIYTDYYSDLIDNTLNCHWHHEFEFAYLLSGELDYYVNDTCLRLNKGDCVFINSNTLHMAKQRGKDEDAIMFTIAFPASLFTANIESTVHQKYFQPMLLAQPVLGFQIQRDDETGREIMSGLRKIYALNQDQYGFELECLSLLSQVWRYTLMYLRHIDHAVYELGGSLRLQNRAKEILSYMHTHYAETLTVEEIARNVGISRSECFRCIRQVANKSPVEYLNEYRLTQAVKLLDKTAKPIADISLACGFSSQSYFGRMFKDKYGLSPAKFRKKG